MTHCGANYLPLITPQILDGLDRTGSPFKKCLRLLRKTCSALTVLPSTYELSGELSVTTTLPVAFGGFCDVYKGTLPGGNVCIKRFRISTPDDQVAVRQVAHLHIFDLIVKS